MESLGYVVTNNFILIAVDKNLEITIGEADQQLRLTLTDAKKVYRISDETAISIIGIPHKITDIYKYILSIQNTNKTYDAVEGDLQFIFNSNHEKLIENIRTLSALIPRFNDGNGVLKQEDLFKHLENEPELLQIAKESITLQNSQTQVTTISLFGRENGKNVFGIYMALGFSIIGRKQPSIPHDNVFFGLQNIKTSQEKIKELEDNCKLKVSPFIIEGWETDKQLEENLYNECKAQLKSAVASLTPYKTTPQIIFYELNSNTNFIFEEPPDKLREVKFTRA